MATNRSAVGPLGLSCLLLGACQYDLDKVFTYSEGDAGGDVPAQLIDLWQAQAALPEACVACAVDKCAAANESCREDESCVALTQCVARAQDPAAQVDCRAQQLTWLSEDIVNRDTGGPFQQCVFLSECASQCDARNQLSCKSSYSWPTTMANSVRVRLRFVEGLAQLPTSGIRVRACRAEDPGTCQGSSEGAVTDQDGIVELELPVTVGAFNGYLELEGGDLFPTLLRFGWPVARDMVTSVTVVNNFSASAIVAMSGMQIEPDRGQLQMRMFGCNGIPTREVSFAVEGADDKTKIWYTQGLDTYPDFNLTLTGDRGVAGAVNVLGGQARIIGTRDGEVVANVRAPVRANYMTIVLMQPGT